MADFLPNPYTMMRSFHWQGINMGAHPTLTAFDHHKAIQQSVSIRILVKFCLFACRRPIYLSKRRGPGTHRGCPTGENSPRILVRMEKFQLRYDRKSSRQLQTNWVLPCLLIFSFYNAIGGLWNSAEDFTLGRDHKFQEPGCLGFDHLFLFVRTPSHLYGLSYHLYNLPCHQMVIIRVGIQSHPKGWKSSVTFQESPITDHKEYFENQTGI